MICSAGTGNSGTVSGIPAAGTISGTRSEVPVSKGVEDFGDELAQDEKTDKLRAQTNKAVTRAKKTFIFIYIGV
jgi:hypothetical protein